MIKAVDVRDQVIIPTLDYLALYDPKMRSKSAENMLLGTVAVESKMGYHLVQEGGPALGIYQIEPRTELSLMNNFVRKGRARLLGIIESLQAHYPTSMMRNNLISNHIYSTAIARLKYWCSPGDLPHEDDIDGMAHYWKKYYNTEQGSGTVQKFIDAYGNYIRGNL